MWHHVLVLLIIPIVVAILSTTVINEDYHLMVAWSNGGLECNKSNNLTSCLFTDVFLAGFAGFVFHLQNVLNLNDEAWHITIWFSWTVCTVRGSATVQPVVRSSRSRCSFLQSDEVLSGIRPVPHDTLITSITANLSPTLKLLWDRNFCCRHLHKNANQLLWRLVYVNWVVKTHVS